MSLRRKDVQLRPHDMIRIAHTEFRAMLCLARTPGPCLDDRPRAASVSHARSGAPDQRSCACSMRPLQCAALANAPAPCAPTWPKLYNMPPPDHSSAGYIGEKRVAYSEEELWKERHGSREVLSSHESLPRELDRRNSPLETRRISPAASSSSSSERLVQPSRTGPGRWHPPGPTPAMLVAVSQPMRAESRISPTPPLPPPPPPTYVPTLESYDDTLPPPPPPAPQGTTVYNTMPLPSPPANSGAQRGYETLPAVPPVTGSDNRNEQQHWYEREKARLEEERKHKQLELGRREESLQSWQSGAGFIEKDSNLQQHSKEPVPSHKKVQTTIRELRPQQQPHTVDRRDLLFVLPPNEAKHEQVDPLSPSPWKRDEKEKREKLQQQELLGMLEREIWELQSKTERSAEEGDRLRKLLLEREFQRRLQETRSRGDDDDYDDEEDDDGVPDPRWQQRQQQEDNRHRLQLQEEERARQQKEAEDRARQQREAEDRARQQREAEDRARQQREAEDRARQQREAEDRARQQREAEDRARQQREAEDRARQQREAEDRARQQQEAEDRARQQREAEDCARRHQEAEDRSRQQQESEQRARLQREAEERAQLQREAEEHAQQQREAEDRARQHQEAEDRARQQREAEDRARQQREVEDRARQQREAEDRARRFEEQRQREGEYYAHLETERRRQQDVVDHQLMGADLGNKHPAPPARNKHLPPTPPQRNPLPSKPPDSVYTATMIHYYGEGDERDSGMSITHALRPPVTRLPRPLSDGYTLATATPYRPPASASSLANLMQHGSPLTFVSPGNSTGMNSYSSGNTPGVIGSQEVYRDPRERLRDQQKGPERVVGPEKLTFRERQRLFSEGKDVSSKMKTSRRLMELEQELGNK